MDKKTGYTDMIAAGWFVVEVVHIDWYGLAVEVVSVVFYVGYGAVEPRWEAIKDTA
jgi:hypothetical protein